VKNIIVFFFLMALSGCGFVFQNLGQEEHTGLMYGMPKEEVASKIGKPQKISMMAIGNREYEVWEYPNANGPKIEKMNVLGISYLKAFFFDGKLVQYHKNRVYAQPLYEFLEPINSEGGVNTTKITE
jgi:hypothetical protein